MRYHRLLLAALVGAVPVAACSDSTAAPKVTVPANATDGGDVAQTDSGGGSDATAATSGEQFGSDVCSALTEDDISAAPFPGGTVTMTNTATQNDADTGKPAVCQYLGTIAGGSEVVVAAVSLESESAYANLSSPMGAPEPVDGVGTEAKIVQATPGFFEVWVHATNGYFSVGSSSKDVAIAFATAAAARN